MNGAQLLSETSFRQKLLLLSNYNKTMLPVALVLPYRLLTPPLSPSLVRRLAQPPLRTSSIFHALEVAAWGSLRFY